MARIRTLLPALALVLFGLTPRPAAADPVIAMNDSIDFEALLEGDPVPMSTCPCFCTYEGFAATFTAPDDMYINFLYLLYGTLVPMDTVADFHLWEGDEPGQHFLVPPDDSPAIGFYMPISLSASQVLEIPVAASGVQPPLVLAGEQFTVGFIFNYGDESGVAPFDPASSNHGPVYDQDGEASAGTNWVMSFTAGYPPCGADGDPTAWYASADIGLSADWVIRASDEQVDWSGAGDDDDDDDASDDDDDAGDDDDDGMVILGITPSSMVEGEDVDLAVTGSGFDDTAQLYIGAFRASNTTFVSEQRIDAGSPQGIPASDQAYEVVVNLADGTTSTLPGAFTVQSSGPGCDCGSSLTGRQSRAALMGLLVPLVGLLRRRR